MRERDQSPMGNDKDGEKDEGQRRHRERKRVEGSKERCLAMRA